MVWVKRWALDARAEIDGAGMVDPRVTHLWDIGSVIDQTFLEQLGVDFGGLDYDFFLLFDRDTTWQQRPPRPISSGATVIGDSDRLADSASITVEPLEEGSWSRVTFRLEFQGQGIGKLVPDVVRQLALKGAPKSYQHLKERLERGDWHPAGGAGAMLRRTAGPCRQPG